ncbi:hypothetical protein NUU61_003361 [Penicillium alfredii]|uniref:Zn(2)-C6 fungal-type domain-containing protein n=1 Tax=Penicillium alfredii TaxID=1506179 RepID=A0A9W9FTC1_9EURO|nr:uncharacterized protein NUU61_003361 [Penicillium alfredii]KAJ5106014.1 hypothetical protein NUU61_003361 [Penicillium alfredii]
MLPGLHPEFPQRANASNMDFVKKRESRTRAPTACQTCRLRKTRCDNLRPVCSYCAVQGVDCIYPESSPSQPQNGFDSTNQEILQRLGHIASVLEDLKQDGGSVAPGRPLKDSFFEMAVQKPAPLATNLSGSFPHSNNTGVEDRGYEHDPLTLYAANSPEYMLRWPIYNPVITEAEKHIRSFLLDSLDSQYPSSMQPPRQMGVGSLLDDIPRLCRKYLMLVHRRNPVVDAEKIERYAREVTVQGLGWDGPSCQVLLACALACCTSPFIPLGEIPIDLDRLPSPPLSDASIEVAETYFHAAKQRFGSLHTSPTDIQCFLLAGFYHRHAMRPLQAWFCFQQASCRLEVRLRSLCRERWTADVNYHNLESRLYWSCIQAEHEMQSELPLWSSGLESLGYSDPFPTFPKTATSSPDQMEDDQGSLLKPGLELSGTEEEKGWRFYIGSICNRRTVNDMLIDMWRDGEQGWVANMNGVLDQTTEAVKVVYSWYKMSLDGLPSPSADNQDLEFFLRGRYHICLEKIYRPVFYLAVHYQSLPHYTHSNNQLFRKVFEVAQEAVDNCAELIPNYWYHFRHEWIWNIVRATFGAAIQIIGAVLGHLNSSRTASGWGLRPPHNWPALIRLSIRTLRLWSIESIDVDIMRSTLERMYQGTCRLAGVRPDNAPF